MDLLQNPFYILMASLRDNRRRIMELADERSFFLDSSLCMEACADLTNPRKRLSAEIAWLPGIGPKQARTLLSSLESSPADLFSVDKKLPSLTRANLLAAGLARLSDCNTNDMEKWILELAQAFDEIKPEELSILINEEREISGFPKISDIPAIETEIQERRMHYRQVIKSALDNLFPQKLVKTVTDIVDSATNEGEEQGPILIADLVDAYEVEAQAFLNKEEGNIKTLIKKLRSDVDAKHPDSALAPTVNRLIQIVKNWDSVAQPIQVSMKGRGLAHNASKHVAFMLRELSVYIFNKHNKLDFAQRLTSMLQEVFAEVGEVAEYVDKDADTLKNIAKQQMRVY